MASPTCSVHFFFLAAPDFVHVHGFRTDVCMHARVFSQTNEPYSYYFTNMYIYSMYLFYSLFRCGSSLIITEHANRDRGSKTVDNLPHRATVQPLLQGHGIPECTQASYVMLQLWSCCKNEKQAKTKQLLDAQHDSNVPDVCPRQPASARGKWNLHAGRRRGATGEELDEWGR